jgi:hypothetical protein
MIERMFYRIFANQSAIIMLIVIVLLLICSGEIAAQGFDWQYSSRLPSTSPTLFLGGSARVNYGFHTADTYFLGDEYRCGDYKSGKETGFSVGLAAEYWQTGVISIWCEAEYRNLSVIFSSTDEPQPFKLGGVVYSLSREFQMKSVFHAIETQGGIKWRFAPTHIHVFLGLRGTLSLKSTAEQTETILTPIEFTQTIRYGQTPLTGIRTLFITPLIGIGYDAELGRGIYATPTIRVGLPLMSYSSVTSWVNWDYSAGIKVLTHF